MDLILYSATMLLKEDSVKNYSLLIYLCDTVMGICDSDNSEFGYKSAHMGDNCHHSTARERIN